MLRLEDLEVYQLSETLADLVWEICISLDWFAKDTIGKQLVRAADSIGANIAEGFGRFSYKENIQFCYYARGSLLETRHWLRRAKKRNLLTAEQENALKKVLQLLSPKLNAYIKVNKQQTPKEK
ncbi:MAG: four helix bundle protein [Ignavibacteria bacterium]|nr:four helix bundle protein [Ignavibacteria bacterium]